MINSYFSRIIYSMYFMARKNSGLSYFTIDMGYMIFGLSMLSTIQVLSAVNFISLISVYFSGYSIILEASDYYIILTLIFALFWFSLGGLTGMRNLIKLNDTAPNIDGEKIFNIGLGKYILLTLIGFLVGMACAFIEGKLIRGEFS